MTGARARGCGWPPRRCRWCCWPAIVVLAVLHYATLLGVGPGDPAAWALPATYAVVAVAGVGWGVILRVRRPQVYAAIGLGAHAAASQYLPVAGTVTR